MSVLRSIGKIIGGLLFTFFLSTSILSISLVDFTSYSNLKSFTNKILSNGLSQQIDDNQLHEIYGNLKQQCKDKESASLQLGDLLVNVDCSQLKSINIEDLFGIISGTLFDSIYNRTYNCQFLECIQQPGSDQLLVLFSQQANKFLMDIQIVLWAITAFGAFILYISAENLKARLRIFGSNLIFTGASYLIVTYAANYFIPSENLPGNINIESIVNGIFGKVTNYFIVILILGILLFSASYLIDKKRGKK